MAIEQLLERAIQRMESAYPANREVLAGDIPLIAALAQADAAQRQAKAQERQLEILELMQSRLSGLEGRSINTAEHLAAISDRLGSLYNVIDNHP